MTVPRSFRPSRQARGAVLLAGFLAVSLVLALGPVATLAKPEHDQPQPPAFMVQPNGVGGPLVGYDMATGRSRFSWPAGLLAADGSRYFAATVKDGTTAVEVYDPKAGSFVERVLFDGSWALRGVAANGHWFALARIPRGDETAAWTASGTWKSDFAIVDALTSKIVHEVHLDGNFEVDTISASGDALFVIQHQPAVNPDHYSVRLYDLTTNTLQEGSLRDKREPDEVMAGYPWQGVSTPDGQWLHTLYVNTVKHSAFIHALNLAQRFAWCIDLPTGNGDLAALKAYSLTLSADRQMLYAANPVLGLVAEVDPNGATVNRVVAFPAGVRHAVAGKERTQGVISPDGGTLYFTVDTAVWAYDTRTSTFIRSYPVDTTIAGLGLSPDGTRLYLVTPDPSRPALAVDTASGATVQLMRG